MQNKIQHFDLTSVKRKMVELMKKFVSTIISTSSTTEGFLPLCFLGTKKQKPG